MTALVKANRYNNEIISKASEISSRFQLAHEISTVLQHATLIPDHLRGERKQVGGRWQFVEYEPQKILANVLMVVNRALQWDVDPVALIGESFVVGGKLDFQGKVIIAVCNQLAGLTGNLRFDFEGEGDDREVIVTGHLRGEDEPRETRLKYRDAVVLKDNKPAEQWRKDVDQKLCYSGAKKWARRHAPEVVLGLFAEDDQQSFDPIEHRESPAIEAVATPMPAPKPKAIESKTERAKTFYAFTERVKAAATHAELEEIVAEVQSFGPEKISVNDSESVQALARSRWKDITHGTKHAKESMKDYSTMIRRAMSIDEILGIRDQVEEDANLTDELRSRFLDECNARLTDE